MRKFSVMIIKLLDVHFPNILGGQRVYKHLSNSIPELLNVFEDPAQRVHTIVLCGVNCFYSEN